MIQETKSIAVVDGLQFEVSNVIILGSKPFMKYLWSVCLALKQYDEIYVISAFTAKNKERLEEFSKFFEFLNCKITGNEVGEFRNSKQIIITLRK